VLREIIEVVATGDKITKNALRRDAEAMSLSDDQRSRA
jgi:hypothetical protein